MLKKLMIGYLLVMIGLGITDKVIYEASYSWITCGEALHRHTGSAAPRDKKEEVMYNECLFRGIKRWDKP